MCIVMWSGCGESLSISVASVCMQRECASTMLSLGGRGYKLWWRVSPGNVSGRAVKAW